MMTYIPLLLAAEIQVVDATVLIEVDYQSWSVLVIAALSQMRSHCTY